MGQTTNGFRSLLSTPVIYDFFQNAMGAKRIRLSFVQDQIRPQPGSNILDIGCGTSEILTFLQNVNYYGFDVSDSYINAAKKKFGERGIFHCGPVDDTNIALLPFFDVVMLFGVLHHLDDTEVYSVLSLVQTKLKPSGRLVTIDPCFCENQNPLARFIINRDRGQNVRNFDDYLKLPAFHFAKTSGLLKHKVWLPYTHCIMECSL